MAQFGIECIGHFPNARAAGIDAADTPMCFKRSDEFARVLKDAGHTQSFYWGDTDCYELDIRGDIYGGDDKSWVDHVDICFISTHGRYGANGNSDILFDCDQYTMISSTGLWRLGDTSGENLEWLLLWACDIVDINNVAARWNVFGGLHVFCSSWGLMKNGTTTDECGEDVAENLVDGDTVSEAWIDGVSDWWVDNYPVTICVGNSDTWNNGDIQWSKSFLNADHLFGHGGSLTDLPNDRQACILWRWAEG